MTATIRRVTEENIDAMYEISCSVHSSELYRSLIPAQQYERFLKYYTISAAGRARYYGKIISYLYDSEHLMWVAELDGKVVGYTHAHFDGERLVLRGLFVDDAYQGRGIGKRLFLTSFDNVQADTPIVLDVIKTNARAIHLYETSGFNVVGPSPVTFFGASMIRMQRH